ncbi:leucine--tRNA ligase [Candidatus Falkowbacteria bacterium]|nr:leucine--tRNA ligase [Candidatus Falkowbacteria bacterium]
MKEYNPQKIEKKWQQRWEKSVLYGAKDFIKKPKKYILVEFPYPSGSGLHVGHARSYSALDAIARKKRMEGYNVLFPFGWDAFGLPTENYAIKTGIHPRQATDRNIKTYKRQIKSLGLSVDWSREIDTTDPKYYKWTQWIFLKFFEKGLAYQAEMPINWCPSCKIGLANEEVVDGKCERCGAATKKRQIKQWLLKITAYADKLLKGLEEVDYPEKIKAQQINWIGKSEGTTAKFEIVISNFAENPKSEIRNPKQTQNSNNKDLKQCIEIFTTRVDTIFGVTALVLAPERPIIKDLESRIKNYEEVEKYIKEAAKKPEIERTSETKERTGVELKGIFAINPVNNEKVPVWIADYVLAHYGGGAVMVVPAHDKRDWDFAKKYNIPIKEVISGGSVEKEVYPDYGKLVNSGQFNGMTSQEAIEEISRWLEEGGFGKKKIEYKLRDWIFSRQHYWGEPIPLIFCESCKKLAENSKLEIRSRSRGTCSNSKQIQNPKSKIQFSDGELLNPGWIAMPENKLPVELPYVKKYQPTDTGESPLAAIKNWVNVKCPKCKGSAKRETDTMPNWAGSSWYYLAYLMRGNSKSEARNPKQIQNNKFKIKKYVWDKKKINYWMPVDLYNGGMEHTTLHLLYSRFWHRFLYDLKLVPTPEPYARRRSHGMVLAEDGQKMSKSRGNVVNPDEIIKIYGADALRIYEMFMGPFDRAISWNQKGLVGCYRFLSRVWEMVKQVSKVSSGVIQVVGPKIAGGQEIVPEQTRRGLLRELNKTIKKVSEDMEEMKFNTAIACLMESSNEIGNLLGEMEKWGYFIPQDIFETYLKLLSPFAPHLAEELWSKLGHKKSIFYEKWLKYDPKLIREETFELVVQINGKVRDAISATVDISEEDAKELALNSEKVQKWLENKPVRKVIFVKNRLINLIV